MDETRLLDIGDRFGDYVIDRLLGKGGMGAVYLIRQPESGAVFAAKIMIPPEGEEEHEFRRRFAREAEIAMKVNHRNLIKVYDVGEDPDTGLCYIIMDYVPGGSVTDRLKAQGRMGIEEALKVTVRIASALGKAHKAGVVHRDIKPDNIMFDADGTPKLADLGIAKLEDEEEESKTLLTGTGIVIGTPAYMAPEQMMDSHRVTAKADIYSLGMVLYEMLTGVRPHGNSSVVELMAKVIKGEELKDVRELRPEVPDVLAKVIKSMCANNPDERPADTDEVIRLCRDAATYLTTGKQGVAGKAKLAIRRLRFRKSTRLAVRGILAAGLAAGLLGIGFVIGSRGGGEETAAAPKYKGAETAADIIREVEGEEDSNRIDRIERVGEEEKEPAEEEQVEEVKLEGWDETVTGDETLEVRKEGKWVMAGNNNCALDRGNFAIGREMRIAVPENVRGLVKDPKKLKVRSVTFGTTLIPAGRDAKEVRVAESIAVGGRKCDRRVLVARENDAGCFKGKNYTRTDGLARYEFDDLTLEIGRSYKLEIMPQENGHKEYVRFAAAENTGSGILKGLEFDVPWRGKRYGPVVRIEIEEEEEPKEEEKEEESSLVRRLSAPSGTSQSSWLPSEAELLRRITNRLDSAGATDLRGQDSSAISQSQLPRPEPPVDKTIQTSSISDGVGVGDGADKEGEKEDEEEIARKVAAIFEETEEERPYRWRGKSRNKELRELNGGVAMWKDLVNTAKARRKNPMRDWKRGCMVVGKLDMMGLKGGEKVLSPACINVQNGTFAMAVHPDAGKVVFVAHGYAVKEIEVPECDNKWQEETVVDLGTVQMRKLSGSDKRSVAFKTPTSGGSNKVQVEMAASVANMGKWNLIALNSRGKTNPVKMEMQGELWKGTFGGGIRNTVGGCANCVYEVRIKNARGRTFKREADLTTVRALELGNVN